MLWTILLSVLKSPSRRKYLWNQLISHPLASQKSVQSRKFIHQHFHCLAFCLLLHFFMLTISRNYLNEQSSSLRSPVVNEKSRKTEKSDTFNAFSFVHQSLIWILKFIVRGSGRFRKIYLHAKLEMENFWWNGDFEGRMGFRDKFG